MKALILAGGFGTRLRPLSCTRPKILFPIVNKPLLQWTLERLTKNNIGEAILATDLQTEVYIKKHKMTKRRLRITYSRDPLKKPLGTGGPIKKAERILGHHAPFLVLNGDIFADVNYRELSNVHEGKNGAATIALYRVKDPGRYGVAELAGGNRIKRFIEKPPTGTAPTNLINAGVYVLSPEIFKYIPRGRKVSIEREVFPKLAEKGKLYGHVFNGLWMDIGKLKDYMNINKILLDSIVNHQEHKIGSGVTVKKPVVFDKRVSIGEKSVVGPYVVLGQNVIVGNNVHIQDSVILPGTAISDSSVINGAIIGENVVIGKAVMIAEECVLGDHVKIADNVSLVKGVSICPAKEISESVLTPKNII